MVKVEFDTSTTSFEQLLAVYWASLTSRGTSMGAAVPPGAAPPPVEYRSMIVCFTDEQQRLAEASLAAQNRKLNSESGGGGVVSELSLAYNTLIVRGDRPGAEFVAAETYHQKWYGKLGESCAEHGFIGEPWAPAVIEGH